MANYVLFISENKLKDTTAIGANVDIEHLLPYIRTAQKQHIERVLGTDLFEKLKTEIGGTPSGVYLTLLKDYVQKCLCQFTLATLYPVLRLRAVNHSVVQMNNEQGNSATYEDIQPLIDSATDMAEFYRQRMIDYLQNNTSSFPEYSSNEGSDMSPTTRNYYSGINMETTIDDIQLKALLSGMGVKNI